MTSNGWLQIALFALIVIAITGPFGGLAYFPAVSLGPVTEQVAMNQGTHFLAP